MRATRIGTARDELGRSFELDGLHGRPDMAQLLQTKTLEAEGFTYTGFIDPHGVRLMRITDREGRESWVRVTGRGARRTEHEANWTYAFR